ncbi:MAG: ATP-dependent helicase RhlE [Patescibacteria group bacterium]|nr:ATP-dependent helicase RhlE [Patescibacteria group bacterium]
MDSDCVIIAEMEIISRILYLKSVISKIGEISALAKLSFLGKYPTIPTHSSYNALLVFFKDLGLSEPILRALDAEGYSVPTPIQAGSIPVILDGRDIIGCAQTGTGKTAAFSLPVLQLLSAGTRTSPHFSGVERSEVALRKIGERPHSGGHRRPIRCLVLTPTRELAIQIGESLSAYGCNTGLRHTVIFGGVGQGAQTDRLSKGVDILVATPGRLIDLMGQGYVDLRHIEIFILDEADRMLDMGFIHDVRKVIAKIPADRQTLLFSATMPEEIVKLSQTILKNPARVEVTPVSSTAEKVAQSVYFVSKNDKRLLLVHLLKNPAMKQVLVFSRTKHGADKIVKDLQKSGIHAEAIHGNKSQNARQRALGGFKEGEIRVLVATDIAARGIDIDNLAYVVNYDLPNEPESYVHRIGRTGRAGASGLAMSFCDGEEREYLRDIERLIKKNVPVIEDHPFPTNDAIAKSEASAALAAKRVPRGRGAPRSGRFAKPEDADALSGRYGRPSGGAKPAGKPGTVHAPSRDRGDPRGNRGRNFN